MCRGKVKWFNDEKGYGFIENEIDPTKDIFVHYTAIVGNGYKSLEEGAIVDYTLIETTRGGQAINVIRSNEVTV